MIRLVKGTRKYNERAYGIKDIDLVLPSKGLVLVYGESGAGKTTLLNILTASDSITSGELYYRNARINNKNMEDYRSQHVAIVYQDFELINNLSVYDNVALGASIIGEVSEERIHKILQSLNMLQLKDSLISECSGGEIQRVSIARALAKNTDMIFADEPTGNLDTKNSENIFKILKEISKEKLVVVISHDVKRAKAYSDYCIELEDGEIINNDCPNEEDKDRTPIDVKKRNPKLPLDLMYKLSRWNVSRRNLKPIFNIVIIALIMSMLYLMLPLAFYDYPLALSKNLKKAELPLVMIKTVVGEDPYNMEPLLDIDDKWGLKSYPTVGCSIRDDLSFYYHEKGLYHDNGVYVGLRERVTQYDESFGIDFVYGRAPEQDYEVAISLTQAYNIVSMKGIYNQDKEIVEVDNIDELIGKYLFANDKGIRLVITGVFEDYYIYREHQKMGIVALDDSIYNTAADNFLTGLSFSNHYTMVLLSGIMSNTTYHYKDFIDTNSLKPLANMELTEYNLSENGILIGQHFADENDIQIGDSMTIKRARDKKSVTFVVEYIELYSQPYINPDTYYEEFGDSFYCSMHIVNIGDDNQLKKLRLIEKEIGRPTTIEFFPQLSAYTYSINSYDLADIAIYLIELSMILFIPISIGLIIVLFLNTNALTNYSISQSMKDFSILRSIGYSKRSIRNIIILKSLLVAIPQILIGIMIGLIMVVAFNRIMSMQTITQITIIALDIRKFLIINVVAFLSYALVILAKSNSLFKDSAVINYKKR